MGDSWLRTIQNVPKAVTGGNDDDFEAPRGTAQGPIDQVDDEPADYHLYDAAPGELPPVMMREPAARPPRANGECDAVKSNDEHMAKNSLRARLKPGQVEFTQRAFIPQAKVLGFTGDNRGLSACLGVPSRANQVTVIDYNRKEMVAGDKWSDRTAFGDTSAYATPRVRNEVTVFDDGSIVLKQDLAAADPLVPGAPDVDMHTRYATRMESDGTLKVWMGMWSDKFPSEEVLLRDPSNQTILLFGFNTDGGLERLLGDNYKATGASAVEVRTDERGNFVSVREMRPGQPPEAGWMSVDDWNARAKRRAEG